MGHRHAMRSYFETYARFFQVNDKERKKGLGFLETYPRYSGGDDEKKCCFR